MHTNQKMEMEMNISRRRYTAFALTAALGCAPIAVIAQTSTQVYGVLDVWTGSSRLSGDAARTAVVNSGGMTTSYWGIAGSEELGGSLKASFAIESYLQLDTGAAGRNATDALFSRRAYVGLGDNNYGEIKLGRLINPLFESVALSNPFGGSTRFSPLATQVWVPTFGRVVAGDTTWDNAISYTTPLMSGFKVTGQLGLGETTFGTGTNNSALNVSYSTGPIYATFGAQRIKAGPGITTVGTTSQTTYFAGGAYDFRVAKLFASYQRATTEKPDSVAKTMQIGVAAPVANGNVLMSWARTNRDFPLDPSFSRNTAAVGYDYFLSKRTDAYFVYQYDKLSNASQGNTVGLGLRHKF